MYYVIYERPLTIDVTRCWLKLIYSYQCWLILIDADWCWLILIDAEWCWLIRVDADWFWLMLKKGSTRFSFLGGSSVILYFHSATVSQLTIVTLNYNIINPTLGNSCHSPNEQTMQFICKNDNVCMHCSNAPWKKYEGPMTMYECCNTPGTKKGKKQTNAKICSFVRMSIVCEQGWSEQ